MNSPNRNSNPADTNRTVLVLDDDVLVRMPVVQFLRDCGYRVVEAASTDEAIVILQKTNIPVDVVLSEIGGGSQRRSGRSLSRARASVHRRLGVHCELAK